MKQLKCILFVALSAMIFSCNSNQKGSNKSAQATPAELAPAGSIVYVQMDSLFNQYDMTNDLKSELEAKVANVQGDLAKQGRAFESDAKDFESKVKKGLLTQSQAELQNRQLVERQQSLQNLGQQKQMEIEEEQQVLYRKVMESIKLFLTKYNTTHNYALILTTSGTTNTILVGNPSLDITNDVLAGLNDEYVKEKKSSNK
jgi:outer membrane protein